MMEQSRPEELDRKLDSLLAETDTLLTSAEQAIDQQTAWLNCRTAVRQLLTAFLMASGEKEAVLADMDLFALWEKCCEQDPDLHQIAAEIRLFQTDPAVANTKEGIDKVLDAANEVWDFIFGSLTE